MRQFIAVVTACALLSGCTGSFELTKKVYNLHREQKDQWMDELIFLGVVILPVYSLATLGDALIFNTIEFWSGENPLLATKVVEQGGSQACLTTNEDQTVTISSGKEGTVVLEKTADGVICRDSSGEVLYTSVSDGAGAVTVYNGQKQPVQRFSTEQVDRYREKMAI